MGYWGTGTFENDDAMEWAQSLNQSEGLGAVDHALRVPGFGDSIPAPAASEALAAAEVVAALLGKPSTDLPLDVARWVAEHRGLNARQYRELALNSARAILSIDSVLRQRWKENEEDYPFWKATVEALIARLTSTSESHAAL